MSFRTVLAVFAACSSIFAVARASSQQLLPFDYGQHIDAIAVESAVDGDIDRSEQQQQQQGEPTDGSENEILAAADFGGGQLPPQVGNGEHLQQGGVPLGNPGSQDFGAALQENGVRPYVPNGAGPVVDIHGDGAPKRTISVTAAFERLPVRMFLTTVGLAKLNVNDEEQRYTAFMPVDSVFNSFRVPFPTLLFRNWEWMSTLPRAHIVCGTYRSQDLSRSQEPIETLNGSPLTLTPSPGGLLVNGQRVIRSDIEAKNGVIHLVDGFFTAGPPTPP